MKEIQLTQGKVALVDDEDYDLLNQFKWQAREDGNTYYAIRSKKKPGEKKLSILMHRFIVYGEGCIGPRVDHAKNDGLNNQRNNLRPCTNVENCRNANPQKNATSKFKGVYYHKKNRKYVVQICVNYKQEYLGIYESEREAAEKYNEAAKKYFGNFAKLNTF